jgi:hypothetical protein
VTRETIHLMNRIDSNEIESYILPAGENKDIFSKSHGYHLTPDVRWNILN